MKIVFVINNKNNRLQKVLPGLSLFCQQNFEGQAEFVSTQRREHAIDLAREATENGCNYIIAVGGDGTLHEVINGVMQSDKAASDYPVIGLLPYGSANDFARTANISRSFEELNNFILSKSIQKIDLGKITLSHTGQVRHFINITGIGLGAEVAQNIAQSSSFLGAGFNYFKHIIQGFFAYQKKEVNCTSNKWQWHGKLLQMAVANGRYFGNAICVAPDAILSDGEFQLAIFGDLSVWDYLKNLGSLRKGKKISHPQVSYHKTQEIRIESKEACGIEADGEYVGQLPTTITVLPQAIRFLMPTGVGSKDKEGEI